MTTWDEYFIRIADTVSEKSKDPHTKVGAVIVRDKRIISTGYNGFPRGVTDAYPRWQRPEKYNWVVHAELNAIAAAARFGPALDGCELYLNWEPYPCNECCKAVINAGIQKVVGPNRPFVSLNSEKRKGWEESFKITKQMLDEAGVFSKIVDVPLFEES